MYLNILEVSVFVLPLSVPARAVQVEADDVGSVLRGSVTRLAWYNLVQKGKGKGSVTTLHTYLQRLPFLVGQKVVS